MKRDDTDYLELFNKVWHYVEKAFIAFAAVFIAMWAIPPLKDWLQRETIFDEKTIYDIFAITLIALLGALTKFMKIIRQLATKLDKFSKESKSQIIENGVSNVYPHLNSILESIDNKKEKSLRVIGLTLFSAWPQIAAWLDKGNSNGWEIELFILDADYIKNNRMNLPALWIKEAESVKERIEGVLEDKKNLFERSGVKINLISYSNLPVIHGFKIGDGSLYISFSHWSEKKLIDEPHYFYEYFDSEDKSSRAKSYRGLFDNWTGYYDEINANFKKPDRTSLNDKRE